MPNKPISMLIARKLILLVLRGFSVRAISRELKISSKTVVQYRKRINSSGKTLQELQALDDAVLAETLQPRKQNSSPDWRTEQFASLVDDYLSELARKRATRAILYEEYRKQYPD